MTKEEILAMEAGAILDATVAEQVMGIQGWFQYSDGLKPKAYRYSTDISAAWQVVEKMKGNRQFMCELINRTAGWSDFNHKYELNDWLCSFLERLNPEAICKAALLAKLKEEK